MNNYILIIKFWQFFYYFWWYFLINLKIKKIKNHLLLKNHFPSIISYRACNLYFRLVFGNKRHKSLDSVTTYKVKGYMELDNLIYLFWKYFQKIPTWTVQKPKPWKHVNGTDISLHGNTILQFFESLYRILLHVINSIYSGSFRGQRCEQFVFWREWLTHKLSCSSVP